jgi:hypothetical protein
MTVIRKTNNEQHPGQCTWFVLRSQYVLLQKAVLAGFMVEWPDLKMAVAGFGVRCPGVGTKAKR